MAKFSFIDLFAGIGGFRLALQSVGGKCIGFSEIAPDAIKTYCTNFQENVEYNFGDITKLKNLPKHDFMTAGVPCQSWSIAGKNLGFDDDRGQLWNDTLFLLNKVRPKAFIFENVKGLADPRNKEALDYILERIKQAGYHAEKYLLNSYDYGVPQTRIRIYIVGFREKEYFERFELPNPFPGQICLSDVLDGVDSAIKEKLLEKKARWSLSCNEQGFNDYFLFNDLRNGNTTIHSWDINHTTNREKQICYHLLGNRRKKEYGELDGNPLSLEHFQALDPTIRQSELETLVEKKILKRIDYLFQINGIDFSLTPAEKLVLRLHDNNVLNYDNLKTNRELKKQKINVRETLTLLMEHGVIRCTEVRYDFKNTKISTGLEGINRIFLPSSRIYPTLVASDTNDFVATRSIEAETIEDFRNVFMEKVYRPQNYRKITVSEACKIQGFPADFILPPTRPRWMKLIGNSVAVPVIKMLAQAIVATGVFESCVVELGEHRAPAKRYSLPSDDWGKHNWIQGVLFEPEALYYIKRRNMLIGSCRQGTKQWIQDSLYYNYPIEKTELEEHPELLRVGKLVVKHRKTIVGYYDIKEVKVVTKKDLKELGYPVKSSKRKADAKYLLYSLKPRTDEPQITQEHCKLILGKGVK